MRSAARLLMSRVSIPAVRRSARLSDEPNEQGHFADVGASFAYVGLIRHHLPGAPASFHDQQFHGSVSLATLR